MYIPAMRRCLYLALLGILLCANALPAPAAQEEEEPALPELINGFRLAAGLAPLRLSDELTVAAQRHSADLAATAPLTVTHVGSDGSRPDARIADAGYAAYSDGLFHGENVFAGESAAAALAEWQSNPSDLGNLTRVEFREMGFGVSTDADGKVYAVVTFGARPNVLPVFINDDAAETGSAAVTLLLTNELHQPGGQDPDVMGRATEMRISNEPGFETAEWRPWAARSAWTVTSGEGLKIVYVQFRDTQGRTTAATAGITLSAAAPTATGQAPATQPVPPPGSTAQVTPGAEGTPGPSFTPVAPAARTATAQGGQAAPATPVPGAPEAPAGDGPVAPEILALVCALQIVAVLLTIYVVLRRGQS